MPHAFIQIIFGLVCLFILVIGKSQSDAEIAFIRPRILLFHDKNDVENDEVVIINALPRLSVIINTCFFSTKICFM